eukprot:scaffold17229_cov112-Isochrysis_galbana.AAC.2
MEASLSELLLAEAPPDGAWRLRGSMAWQPAPQLVLPNSCPRQLSGSSDDGAGDAAMRDGDGGCAFSARLWQEALPHGLGVARCAALTRYDQDALDFFKDWAKAEDEFARALGALACTLGIPCAPPRHHTAVFRQSRPDRMAGRGHGGRGSRCCRQCGAVQAGGEKRNGWV